MLLIVQMPGLLQACVPIQANRLFHCPNRVRERAAVPVIALYHTDSREMRKV